MPEQDLAVVIAGGPWQAPLIRFLKEKGHFVCVVDRSADLPGVRLADKHINSDVLDEDNIFLQVKDLSPKFVVTDQSDLSVTVANNLSLRLGLRANPRESVDRFTNKYISRQFAPEAQMPTPRWHRIDSAGDLKTALADIGLPAILKPPDSQASCGVYKIDSVNVKNAAELMQKTLSYSKAGYILCEQYVEGTGLTIEGVCSAGKHRCVAVSQKDHFPSGVISTLLYPAAISDALLEQIFAAVDRYVARSGLQFGLTHTEVIVDTPGEKFWLVETACRGGGTRLSSDIAKWVSGIDLYEILYKDLYNRPTDLASLSVIRRAAYLEFFEFGAGLVDHISGVEEARQLPGVFDLNLAFKQGDTINLAENGRTRQGYFIAMANTHAEVKDIAARVYDTIKVRLNQPSQTLSR